MKTHLKPIGHKQRAISLILPAYNEGETIAQAVAEASQALRSIAHRWEVIVVDDGSRDETSSIVRQAMNDDPCLRIAAHTVNRGYGAALRTGFESAAYPLVAFTDADCQFHLEDLRRLLARIGYRDVVCGVRAERQDPWLRRFYSRCYNVLVSRLLGVPVRDCDCALKVFRAEVLNDLTIETDGFLVNAEILAKLAMAGRSISQVEVRHRARPAGESTVSPLHAFPVLLALIRFWWSWILFPERTERESPEPASVAASSAPAHV